MGLGASFYLHPNKKRDASEEEVFSMVASVELDNCTFLSQNHSTPTFTMRKPSLDATVENEVFEANVYAALVTLLANKLVRIDKIRGEGDVVIFDCHIEEGTFTDIIGLQPKFAKLLSVEQSLFNAFIKSAQAFSDSPAIFSQMYSSAFSLLVYATESIANVTCVSERTKRRRIVKFVVDNVKDNRFESVEIRQLEFRGRNRSKDLLFEKLLERSYILRCKYVHEAEIVPFPSQMAHNLSMAFVSNDQKTLFPSYFWLRRIVNLALNNFLVNQPSIGRNHINNYTEPHRVGKFKAKKTVKKGEFLDEDSIYLQQLDDEFVNEEYLKK